MIHYLEIVTPDVDQTCAAYKSSLGIVFEGPVAELGQAMVAKTDGGSLIGVRAPMHSEEEPATRPYVLVEDIEKAIDTAKEAGGEVALPPMEIPGRGYCAIYFMGGNQFGLWQV